MFVLLRTQISGKINRVPLRYFDAHPYGDTLSRVRPAHLLRDRRHDEAGYIGAQRVADIEHDEDDGKAPELGHVDGAAAEARRYDVDQIGEDLRREDGYVWRGAFRALR